MTEGETIAKAAIDCAGALQHHGELAPFLDWLDGELGSGPLILEIGSDAGGTLFAWRTLRPAARIVAVSLSVAVNARNLPCVSYGAVVIDGDSHDPAVQAEALRQLGARPSLVFVDGDHTLDGCRADVEWAADLLDEGGLLALHDVAGLGLVDMGCPQVWAELLDDPRWCAPRTWIQAGTEWGGIGVVRRTVSV